MQKLESIGRMTSGIAHDFNNILACMLGYNGMNEYIAEDLTDKTLKLDLANNTEQINIAGQRAVKLIEKMMAYCRQDSKEGKVDVKPTQEVINQVLVMLRPALTSRIKLEFVDEYHINKDESGELSYSESDIQIDATDLHQILTNLAVNARDAMKEHGNTITIFLKKVTDEEVYCAACAGSVKGNFIELSVMDNGTGIDVNILPRLFDPFFTTKPQGEGTGLGLSTVSGMVHQSGGHILIDSNMTEPNRGTTFRLLFPIFPT
jgi:signal transduction histidine kinase